MKKNCYLFPSFYIEINRKKRAFLFTKNYSPSTPYLTELKLWSIIKRMLILNFKILHPVFYSLLHDFFFRSHKRFYCVTRRYYLKPLHQLDFVFFKTDSVTENFGILENETWQKWSFTFQTIWGRSWESTYSVTHNK